MVLSDATCDHITNARNIEGQDHHVNQSESLKYGSNYNLNRIHVALKAQDACSTLHVYYIYLHVAMYLDIVENTCTYM